MSPEVVEVQVKALPEVRPVVGHDTVLEQVTEIVLVVEVPVHPVGRVQVNV